MFREISSKLNLAENEEKILEFWKDKQIFNKSMELRGEAEEFVFYEGPPTANGRPGIHHVMSRTVKDVVCRYKTMKGFLVHRKAGWDTHGLPVEIEVEKQLNISGKSDIEKYGVSEFNKKCQFSVFHYKKEWDWMTQRIGYWLDLDDPYITFTNDYIESVWWILKEFWKKDLLYQGFKILPYCPRCETPISSHEVSQGYKDVKDPSIYVRVKKTGTDNEYILVWTTTPWTLISNVALAVHPEIDYLEVESEGDIYTIAEERLHDLFKEGDYEIRRKFKGAELAGTEYERIFDFIPVDKKAFYVVTGDFVTTSDGTGVVHIAPAFGEDDYQLGLKYDLPVVRPVNASGKFEDLVTDYKGQFVKDADAQIIQDLRERKVLVRKQMIEHSYPHCWRCQTPLLYYARESWYIRTSKFKDRLLENNAKIQWYPAEVGAGRFGEWLKNNIDWSLSRDRYWGTPLNIWICDDCEATHAIGSVEELRERGHNVSGEVDLHKPWVDGITISCEKCNGTMHRVPEVIDCWFDSGSMPYAQHHYPFENKEKFDEKFPADFICEGIDQTRGWFYSLLAISTLLFDKPAYKKVVVNELILDKEGQKMSKSRGNAVVPEDILKKYGADALRWYLMTVSPPWTPKRFDEEGIVEGMRKFINTLINTYSFFVMYANIDNFDPKEAAVPFEKRPELDRWILSKLYSKVNDINQMMDNYELTRAARALSDYVVDDLSNWYVRRNRRRFWKSEDWQDKLSAYQTLHEVLLTIARISAPFTPFLSEEIFRNLSVDGAPESVHLDEFPVVTPEHEKCRDAALEHKMALAQEIVSVSLYLRNDSKVKVRQPLQRIVVFLKDRNETDALKSMSGIICDELNVKEMQITEHLDELVSKSAKPNFKVLGPKVGKLMGKIAPVIQGFAESEIRNIEINGHENLVIDGHEIRVTAEDVEIISTARDGFVSSGDAEMTIALDLNLTDDLLDEGVARELVNRIQNFRKEINLAITDRIELFVETGDEKIRKALKNKADYIMNETLTTELHKTPVSGVQTKEISIDDQTLKLSLKKSDLN